MKSEIAFDNLDPFVVPMVRFFNENALKTAMSCQGHNKTNMSMFWIEFDKAVTEDDILVFMQKHLDKYGMFISCGRFAKRVFGGISVKDQSWVKSERWCYFAATVDAANEDLIRWMRPSEWNGSDDKEYKAWCADVKRRTGLQ